MAVRELTTHARVVSTYPVVRDVQLPRGVSAQLWLWPMVVRGEDPCRLTTHARVRRACHADRGCMLARATSNAAYGRRCDLRDSRRHRVRPRTRGAGLPVSTGDSGGSREIGSHHKPGLRDALLLRYPGGAGSDDPQAVS